MRFARVSVRLHRRTGSVKVHAFETYHVRAIIVEGTARERRRRRRDRWSIFPARPHLRRVSCRDAAQHVSPRPFIRSGRDCHHIQFVSFLLFASMTITSTRFSRSRRQTKRDDRVPTVYTVFRTRKFSQFIGSAEVS